MIQYKYNGYRTKNKHTNTIHNQKIKLSKHTLMIMI